MSLTKIVEKENISPMVEKGDTVPEIYSPKLSKYIPLDLGNPKGEIQQYNIGMGPGSWY